MKLKLLIGVYVCLALLSGARLGARLEAPLSAEAVEQTVTISDGNLVAKFAVQVTNATDAPLSGISVVFADGSSAAIADLAARASAKSARQEKFFTFPEGSSRSLPITVTLRYTAGGELRESEATLYLHAQ